MQLHLFAMHAPEEEKEAKPEREPRSEANTSQHHAWPWKASNDR